MIDRNVNIVLVVPWTYPDEPYPVLQVGYEHIDTGCCESYCAYPLLACSGVASSSVGDILANPSNQISIRRIGRQGRGSHSMLELCTRCLTVQQLMKA